jgi:hypothetical protein
MAVGQVSSISTDNWQLIATNSPTSGTSSSFTGLSGYKKYKLVWDGVVVSASGYYSLVLNFNGSTTKYAAGTSLFNSAVTNNSVSDTKIPLFPYSFNDTTTSGWIEINDVTQAVPKTTNGYSWGTNTGYFQRLEGGWYDTAAVTSIAISTWNGTATFSAGSIKLYGLAA